MRGLRVDVFHGHFDPSVSRNAGNLLPSDAASHPTRIPSTSVYGQHSFSEFLMPHGLEFGCPFWFVCCQAEFMFNPFLSDFTLRNFCYVLPFCHLFQKWAYHVSSLSCLEPSPWNEDMSCVKIP